jgi:hypothetical protein
MPNAKPKNADAKIFCFVQTNKRRGEDSKGKRHGLKGPTQKQTNEQDAKGKRHTTRR